MVNLEKVVKVVGTYCYGTKEEIENLRSDPNLKGWYSLMTYAHFTLVASTLFGPLRPVSMVLNSDFLLRMRNSVSNDVPLSRSPGLVGMLRGRWCKSEEKKA